MISVFKISKLRRLRKLNYSITRCAKECHVDRKTASKYTKDLDLDLDAPIGAAKAPRTYVTRKTEFDKFWPEIQAMLENEKRLKPYSILEHMIEKYKNDFDPKWQKTLERRISKWRIANGIEKEVFFPQIHKPADVLAIDFTDLSALGIRIASEPLDSNHLVFHAALTYSNWEYVEFCRSESFEALASGVQNAFHAIGGVTARIRFDSMTAAVNNLSSQREFQPNWKKLLKHFGLDPHRINIRSPEENGDCESLHGHFKDYLDQRLLLRGNRNFESLAKWREFLKVCCDARNKSRSAAEIAQELEQLESLPKEMFPTFTLYESTVKSSCILRVKQNDYSVPSCFIGKRVQLLICADHIELWYAGSKELEMPRLHGKNNVYFDYRCVIDTLVRKPGAFANYRYREFMFPTVNFRIAFDSLCDSVGERQGIRSYVKLLHTAKHISQEAVDTELAMLLLSKTKIDAKAIEAKLQSASATPESSLNVDPAIGHPELDDFDSLLEHKEVLDEPYEPGIAQHERGTLEATEPIRTGWPLEVSASANNTIDSVSSCRTSSTGALDVPGVPERADGPRVFDSNGESHHPTHEEVFIGEEQDMVGDQVESPTDGGATTDATTSDRRVSIEGGKHLIVREAGLGEDVAIECVGGAIGSPRAHDMLRTLCEIGTAHVTCQAGVSSTTTTNETWSILGIDHRRSGICPTESRGDGSAFYFDRGSLREIEYSAEFESAVFEMGADLQGPDDDGSSHRSLGAPQLDHRAQRPEQAIGRSQREPSEATHSRHGYPIITQWESTKFHCGIVVVAKAEM